MKIFTQKEITGSLCLDEKDEECLKKAGVILESITYAIDKENDFDYIELINKRRETVPEFLYALVHETASVFRDILEMWNEKNR
jgi:hypothetical protein